MKSIGTDGLPRQGSYITLQVDKSKYVDKYKYSDRRASRVALNISGLRLERWRRLG